MRFLKAYQNLGQFQGQVEFYTMAGSDHRDEALMRLRADVRGAWYSIDEDVKTERIPYARNRGLVSQPGTAVHAAD